MEPQAQPASAPRPLALQLLAQCLQDVLGRAPEPGVDAGSLDTLRQTAQVGRRERAGAAAPAAPAAV